MASFADTMPELVLVTETNAAAAPRARRLAAQGALRRLYPRIYTPNEDYLLPLKALSHSGIAEPLISA